MDTGNGVCGPEYCKYAGYPCPYPKFNASATNFYDYFICQNTTSGGEYYLAEEVGFPPIYRHTFNTLEDISTTITLDTGEVLVDPVPLLPECCKCDMNFSEPLCLIYTPPELPPAPEGGSLEWWIIVLICLGGFGVMAVITLAFWFRLRKTELYIKNMELHQKRSRPPMPPHPPPLHSRDRGVAAGTAVARDSARPTRREGPEALR